MSPLTHWSSWPIRWAAPRSRCCAATATSSAWKLYSLGHSRQGISCTSSAHSSGWCCPACQWSAATVIPQHTAPSARSPEEPGPH